MNKQLDHDIEMAIKARGLMEAMRQWDAEENNVSSEPISSPSDAKHKLVKRSVPVGQSRPIIIPLIKRVFAPMAIAAMLVGVFFIPFGWTASNVGSEFASSNLVQYSSYASLKGAQDDPATFIAEAYVALNEKDYKTAAKLSKETMERLEGTKDPFKLDMFQDAEWYNALANLSRGQLWYVMKAKQDLKRIASSNGKHKLDADVLMKKLK